MDAMNQAARRRVEAGGLKTVSYTHLDVYKRQPHSRSRRFMTCRTMASSGRRSVGNGSVVAVAVVGSIRSILPHPDSLTLTNLCRPYPE